MIRLFEGRGLTIIVTTALAIVMVIVGCHQLLAAKAETSAFSFFDKADTRPVLILAEGQSNVMLRLPYDWLPPQNLEKWNYFGDIDPDAIGTGTKFYPIESDAMNVAHSFAAELARANPHRKVYLLVIARGGIPIKHWLTGASVPDMYAAIKRNMELALGLIGQPVRLVHLRWQGESDFFERNPDYPGDFMAYMSRLRAENWYPPETPMIVLGTSHYVVDGLTNFNQQINIAAAQNRSAIFVDIGSLPRHLFDPKHNYIHMTAEGYEQAGKLAFRHFILAGR